MIIEHDDCPQSNKNCKGQAIGRSKWEKDLGECLIKFRSFGSYATHGLIDSFVHPGLSVTGVCKIRLPVSEDDVGRIIKATDEAGIGMRKESTLRETSVKEWTVNSNNVHFLNANWEIWLGRLVEKACKGLGIVEEPIDVSAKFHKLLISKGGITFKQQEELAINLPE